MIRRSSSNVGLRWVLRACPVALIGVLALAACSSDDSNSSTPATGGSDSGGSDSGGSDSGGSDSGGSGGLGVAGGGGTVGDGGGAGTGGAGEDAPCALTQNCVAVDRTCVGEVDNAGETKLGLRMSEITFSKPTKFATGILASSLGDAARTSNSACNQAGFHTWSWLLQFDTAANTLKTGVAIPRGDITTFDFDTETLDGFDVAPITYDTPVAPGADFDVTTGIDLVMPAFLDVNGDSYILMPIRQARLRGSLSDTGNCIGEYNADGLDPLNSCLPEAGTPGFLHGGSGDGYITLEDADEIIIPALAQSLCVLLTGSNDGQSPQKCVRNNGDIEAQGDWCSMTNSEGGCQDSMEVSFTYAANSAIIGN